MKKFLVVFGVLIFLPCFNIFAQLLVADAAVSALLNHLGAEQVIYYAQQLVDNVTQIENLIQTVENGKKQIEMAAKNLATAKDIRSWDDFTSWYNRQLYLENMTLQTWNDMNVTIGKKQYHITDTYGMANGFNDTYVEYWNKEFTEEQRKAMWLELGLSPSSYAYVQPFRAKADQLVKEGLTAVDISNQEYISTMQRLAEQQDKLAKDKLKPEENQMGDKELQQMNAETLLGISKGLQNLNMEVVKIREKFALDDALDNAPIDSKQPADWISDGFEKLDEKQD